MLGGAAAPAGDGTASFEEDDGHELAGGGKAKDTYDMFEEELEPEIQARRTRNLATILLHYASIPLLDGRTPFADDKGIRRIVAAIRADSPIAEYVVISDRRKLGSIGEGWYTIPLLDLPTDLSEFAQASLEDGSEDAYIPRVHWLDGEEDEALHPVRVVVMVEVDLDSAGVPELHDGIAK